MYKNKSLHKTEIPTQVCDILLDISYEVYEPSMSNLYIYIYIYAVLLK